MYNHLLELLYLREYISLLRILAFNNHLPDVVNMNGTRAEAEDKDNDDDDDDSGKFAIIKG
jgi:hypothetical protein